MLSKVARGTDISDGAVTACPGAYTLGFGGTDVLALAAVYYLSDANRRVAGSIHVVVGSYTAV
ncbi:hypothetical protein ACLBX9_12670 [Methylobacterium sp. A49B]